jgi:heat shock protein HslJ
MHPIFVKLRITKLLNMKTLFQITAIIVLVMAMGACKTKSVATAQSDGITEKYWKLIEINGKPVAPSKTFVREPSIILKNEGNRVNGHGGCNTLTGSYEIDRTAQRIKFSQMATTMMACINMEVEEELKKALEMTDNYSLSADGKYLSLNRARMAPLARFEVVYLK